MALPGILPPVTHHGHLLVDGGVMNNLPVDVMREQCDGMPGPIIACDITGEIDLQAQRRALWRAALVAAFVAGHAGQPLDHLDPDAVGHGRARKPSAGSCANSADYLIEPPMPEIGLRDWKKFDQAIQEGYDTARASIEKNGVPLTSI